MPQRKIDQDFGARPADVLPIYLIPALVDFFFIPYGLKKLAQGNLLGTIPILLFLALIAMGAYLSGRFSNRYHCPDCGRSIPKTMPEDSRAYYCPDCDIIWDTHVPKIPRD